MRQACADDETLLLVGVGVLGDRAAGDAGPVEADYVFVSLHGGEELNLLAGPGVYKHPVSSGGALAAINGAGVTGVVRHGADPSCACGVLVGSRYQATVVAMALARVQSRSRSRPHTSGGDRRGRCLLSPQTHPGQIMEASQRSSEQQRARSDARRSDQRRARERRDQDHRAHR